MMLYLPIAETEFDFIVNHPVFQSPYWFDNEKIINIKDSEGAFKEACAAYEQKIDKTEEPLMLMYIFRPSYYLTFLKFSRRFWSANDFAKVLSEAWVEEENPNGDVNVPVSLSAKWFKQCPKEALMNCEEYDTYLCLPDSFVVCFFNVIKITASFSFFISVFTKEKTRGLSSGRRLLYSFLIHTYHFIHHFIVLTSSSSHAISYKL